MRLAYYHKNKQRLKKVVYKCAVCGEELQDGRQAYCLDCLLLGYKNAKKGEKRLAYKRLANRGYDKETILYETWHQAYMEAVRELSSCGSSLPT